MQPIATRLEPAAHSLTGQFRARHLHCEAASAVISAAAAKLFDEFFETEWIFEHRFGAASAVMACLATALLRRRGWECEAVPCKAMVRRGRAEFHLGAKAWAKAGADRAHWVCVVEGRHLLDFALGDVRRSFDRGFPWAVACGAWRPGSCGALLDLPGHGQLRWSADIGAHIQDDELRRAQRRAHELLREPDGPMG